MAEIMNIPFRTNFSRQLLGYKEPSVFFLTSAVMERNGIPCQGLDDMLAKSSKQYAISN